MTRLWILLVLVLVFSSCGSSESEKFKVGFSQPLMGDAWREAMYDEMQRQLLFHDDIELILKDAKDDAETQVKQINELIEEDIDLLIVSPAESEPLKPIIEAVYKKEIPVILLDRRINSDQFTAYVGADNESIGSEVARYIRGLLGTEGRVLELYESQSITAFAERHQGFNKQVREYPYIKVDTCIAWFRGVDTYKELIQKKHYDVVFAPTDVTAHYAYVVADSLGLADSISFIGIDGLPGPNAGLEYVDLGILKASFVYPTGGDVAIDLASAILNNKQFQKENILPSIVIDKNNVKLMQLQSNKLIETQKNIHELGKQLIIITNVFKTQRILTYLFAAVMFTAIILGAYAFKALVDKRKTNKELEIINEKIVTYANQAEEANQQKLTFFTNISHEFRTPLTLMISPLDELLERKDLSHVRKEHTMIKSNALRLLRLVNQIMDFRKVDVGKMKIRATESDLVSFVGEVVDAFQKAANIKGIKLSFTHEKDLVPVWYDRNMLDKVLFNLLSNALKFTLKGGKINVKMEHNHLDGYVVIIVEDSGTGMSNTDLENIFSRFYQGEQNRSLGTGIGLALSKEIMHLHQGDISVHSVEGKGTRFELRLKTGREHFSNSQVAASLEEHVIDDSTLLGFTVDPVLENEMPITKELKDQTILIIEDNIELRNYLVQRFSSSYNIFEAESVKSGITKAHDEIPDIIICDLMLKKESGYDIIRTLKSDIRSSHIPIIVLTAKADIDERIMGIKLGADDYITKPFNFNLLAERVNTLLINHQKLREHYVSELPIEANNASASKIDKKFINQFTSLVEDNISNSAFGVNDICDHMALSRIQLYRKVKAVLGYSVNDYINNVRLKTAKHLLTTTEKSISEIAHSVGYSSAPYFSTAFKNQFGITPSEYKQS